MAYKHELIARIKDFNKWPAFDRPDFLQELNTVGDDAFSKGTVEGYLASILIYHQITEEMIKLLLECCDFLIQVAIFPAEIQFKRNGRRMFGQILDNLEKSVSFEKKEEYISKCKELNEIRIRMVHRLTRKSSLQNIKDQSSRIKGIFDNIYCLFEEIHDDFKVSFNRYKKDIDWDEWTEE